MPQATIGVLVSNGFNVMTFLCHSWHFDWKLVLWLVDSGAIARGKYSGAMFIPSFTLII
jgi:hypothetical protein